MAKRINKNLVGALTALGVFVTTVAGVVMVVMLPEKDPTFYSDQAVKAFEAEEYAKAAGLYQKAYRVSKDLNYLVEAGSMMYEYGEPAIALQLFRQAISADNQFLKAHLERLRVTVELARLSAAGGASGAVDLWQNILEICEDVEQLEEQNPDMYHARGLARVMLRSQNQDNLEKGIDDLEHAVKLAPQGEDKALDLAIQYETVLKKVQEADDVLRALIAADESNPKSHRYYGEFLNRRALRAGNEPEAETWRSRAAAELEKTVQLDPDDVDNYIALGRFYYVRGNESDRKKSEEYFAKATEVDKDGYRSYLNLGLLHMERGELDQALEVFRERLKIPPVRRGFMGGVRRSNHFMLLRHALLVSLQLAEKAREDEQKRLAYIEEAEGYLKSGIAEVGENGLTRQMRGEIYIAQRRDRDAIRELERADEMSRGVSIDLKHKLAALYLRTNAPGKAHEALLDILRAETAVQGSGSISTLLRLGRLENQLRKPSQALVYTNEVLRVAPNNKEALGIQMQAYQQLGQLDRVAALNERLGGENTTEAKRRKARIAIMQENFQEAEKLLVEILKEHPDEMTTLRLYTMMLTRQDRRKDAMAAVEKAMAARPDDKGFKALQVLLREDLDPEKREELLLAQLKEIKDLISREYQIADYFARKGKEGFPEALKHYRLAEQALDSAETKKQLGEAGIRERRSGLMERQFGLLVTMKDWDGAAELVERCAAENADGVNGMFYRGRLAMVQNELDQAAEYLKAGLEKYPSSSEGLQWLGAVHLRNNDFEEARAAFEQALAINPNNGYAHLGLAQLYDAIGNTDEKTKALKECRRLLPNEPWVRKELQLRQDREDPKKGIARREELRQEEPENIDNLVRLANLYRINAQNDKAEEVMKAAIQVDPQKTVLIASAARFYRAINKDANGKGEALLTEHVRALEDKSAKAKAQLLLAQHHSLLGRGKEAETAFKVAAEIDENPEVCLTIGRWYEVTKRREVAAEWYLKCLEKLGKPTVYVNRLLVDAVLNSTTRKNAAQEVERYRKNFPDDPMVFVYEGRLAMIQGKLDEAIKRFDRYLEREQTNALGYYLRGHLRYLRNQYDAAIDDLTRAKGLAPRGFNYQHRIELAQALGDVGRADEAIGELNAILQEDPNASAVTMALSNTYERNKRYVEQEAFILRYENLQPDDPIWPIIRGRVLEALARPQEAMNALAKACRVSKYNPIIIDRVASRLIHHKLYAEIIDMIEQHVPAEKRSPSLLRWLGRAYVVKGEKDKGLGLYDQALNAAATSHQLYTVIVSDLVATIGLGELTEITRARIQKDKADRTAVRLLVELLIAKEPASSEARSILETLLASETDEAKRIPLLVRMGIVAYSQKKYEESVDYYEKSLKLAPRNAFALNNLAFILAEQLGKPQRALPYAVQAAEVRPSANVFDTVGWTHVLLKNYDDGIAWLLRAKDANPNLVAASYHLAQAYEGKGDRDAAAREYRTAHRLATEQKSNYLGPITEKMRELKVEPKAVGK